MPKKTPKPGQYTVIRGVHYRAYKRTNGCEGCAFNNPFSCLQIAKKKDSEFTIECILNGIILKRV